MLRQCPSHRQRSELSVLLAPRQTYSLSDALSHLSSAMKIELSCGLSPKAFSQHHYYLQLGHMSKAHRHD